MAAGRELIRGDVGVFSHCRGTLSCEFRIHYRLHCTLGEEDKKDASEDEKQESQTKLPVCATSEHRGWHVEDVYEILPQSRFRRCRLN